MFTRKYSFNEDKIFLISQKLEAEKDKKKSSPKSNFLIFRKLWKFSINQPLLLKKDYTYSITGNLV